MSTPKYDDYQSSFHAAFAAELAGIVQAVPLGASVLDVPCGNGFYTRIIAAQLDEQTKLTAVDACDEYLGPLREELGNRVSVVKANAYHLPMNDQSFDTIWCAESLISLEAKPALAEFHRLLKAKGVLAVLEVDEYHHVLLPWPLALEAALPQALFQAAEAKYGKAGKHSPARRLRKNLREVGFATVERKIYPLERVAPYDDATLAFLKYHCDFLRKFAYPYLAAEHQAIFDEQTDVESKSSLSQRAESELTLMLALYQAQSS